MNLSEPYPRCNLTPWAVPCSGSHVIVPWRVRRHVNVASVTPAANAEISTRGVLTAASSRPHFNILSALICSPCLTRYVPLSLLTLSHNSPKSSASHLRNPHPTPLTPYCAPGPIPAADGARPVWDHNASLCSAPLAPFLFIDQLFPIKTSNSCSLVKAQGTFCLVEKKNNLRTSACRLSPFWRDEMLCWLIVWPV